MNDKTLDLHLQKFYAEVRDIKRQRYSRSSYLSLRSGICRHLREGPFYRQVDLVKDSSFQQSNQVFGGMLRKIKEDGLDKSKKKSAITQEDWSKMQNSPILDPTNPSGLQKLVFINIMLHFARRGNEGLSAINKETFVVKTEDRKEFVTLSVAEKEKTDQGEEKKKGISSLSKKMFAVGGDRCPVATYKTYLSKLDPGCAWFFTKPRINWKKQDAVWYSKQKIGRNPLNTMMATISTEAELSKRYTNHCLRATTVTILSRAGVHADEIMAVTGHACRSSVDSYINEMQTERRGQLSNVLYNNSFGKKILECLHMYHCQIYIFSDI